LAVNLLFVAIVVVLLALAFSGGGVEVPEQAALVLAPVGRIVEQTSGDGVQRALDELRGTAEPQTLLVDLVDAVDAARDDERIAALVIDCDRLSGAGMTRLQDVAAAIRRFKETGKPVIAIGDSFSQAGYYLAAQADEILMHPMGSVAIEGFSRYRTYYKEGLDRFEIDWNVFRVGRFKSAVEPFTRNGMSDEARAANLEWLEDLWRVYLNDLAAARDVEVDEIRAYIDELRSRLAAVDGDTGRLALTSGMVDGLANRLEVRQRMIDLVGLDEESESYRQVSYASYLEALGGDRPSRDGDEAVGVVVAVGAILGGSQPPGKIGGDSTAALIRKARESEDVKAVVLRVDSGGGSAFASEIIRNELAKTREEGKPVVVSMASVAASGGYWISTASDEIWAHPTTITGSIGIYGMFPTFQKPMARYLGARVDGVGTTWMSGTLRADRAMSPEVAEVIQMVVENGYQSFLARVAEARGMSIEEVDEIGQGRVWSGEDALRLGLVDKLGSLDDAVTSAAGLAGLDDGYGVRIMEKELGLKDRLIRDLLADAAAFAGDEEIVVPTPALHRVLRSLEHQAEVLAELNDPNGVYAYCMESFEIE
jgi:protease-4